MHSIFAVLLLVSTQLLHHGQAHNPTAGSDSLVERSSRSVRVHPSLPTYYFRFMVLETDDGESPSFDSTRIYVLARADSLPFQIIQDSANGIFDYSLVDANFDGYLDLQIDQAMMASGVNTPSDFWLFNPTTHLFEKSPEFSNFCNVHIDSSKHLIIDGSNWGDRRFCSSGRAFRVEHSHLKLIHEEYSDCDSSYSTSLVADSLVLVNRLTKSDMKDSKGRPYTLLIYEDFIDGQLRVTKKVAIRHLDADANPNLPASDGEDCYGQYKILYEKHIAPPHKKR